MLKALLAKELRETIGVALAALALHVSFVFGLMGIHVLPVAPGRGSGIPFIGDGYRVTFGLVAAGLAIALGFRQSVGEAVGGTYLFLLHRPYRRELFILVKLAVGVALLFAGAALPVLVYAWWAATPGTHASPFQWSMTADVWKTLVSMSALYLGSFLSGIRPGRWKATRLLPLAAVGLVVIFLQFLPWWPILGGTVLVLTDLLLVCEILFVARTRDFS